MSSAASSVYFSSHFMGGVGPRQRPSSRVSATYAGGVRTWTDSDFAPQATTLYQVLGIPTGATRQEIKASYRRLARVLHPDVAASADAFMNVHKAYTILYDPQKRADYDRTLVHPQRTKLSPTCVLSASNNRYSGYTCRRTWETDQCW